MAVTGAEGLAGRVALVTGGGTGIGAAPNGSFIGRTPVKDRAPSVTPW